MKTPTSSKYAVLENKPIDQWKVTELKEELKRRRLKTGGLKDELIKRLDEALRAEMDETNVEPKNDNGVDDTVPENVADDAVDLTEQPIVEAGDFGVVASGNAEEIMGTCEGVVGDTKENVENAVANEVLTECSREKLGMVDNFEVQQSALGNDPVLEEEIITDVADVVVADKAGEEQQSGLSNDTVLGEGIVTAIDVGSVGDKVSKDQKSVIVDDPILGEGIVTATNVGSVGDEVSLEQQSGLVDDPIMGEGLVTATDVASVVVGDESSQGFSSEKEVCGDGLIDDKTERDNRASGEQEHSEGVTPAHEDVKLDSSDQNNQVSEVRTSIGFPVKSNNSVSNDSLSIFEKNDLKDNLIADNVKLESDVKLDMVLPSSSDLVPDVGELHPRDVDEPHENMVSVEETDNTVANADMSQKNYSADLGSSEKLNLDRSSGDDSMEEDALVSKHIDSNFNSEDVEKTNKNEVTALKAESPVATAMDTDLPAETKVIHDQKNDVATLSDKRKLSGENF